MGRGPSRHRDPDRTKLTAIGDCEQLRQSVSRPSRVPAALVATGCRGTRQCRSWRRVRAGCPVVRAPLPCGGDSARTVPHRRDLRSDPRPRAAVGSRALGCVHQRESSRKSSLVARCRSPAHIQGRSLQVTWRRRPSGRREGRRGGVGQGCGPAVVPLPRRVRRRRDQRATGTAETGLARDRRGRETGRTAGRLPHRRSRVPSGHKPPVNIERASAGERCGPAGMLSVQPMEVYPRLHDSKAANQGTI